MQKIISILLIAALFSTGCKDDSLNAAEQLAKDIETIEQYITDNNLDVQSTSSGLHYTVDNPGTGINATIDNKVTVSYKGYYTDGTVFDQTPFGQTVTFDLDGLIQGWIEGIPLYKEGGNGTLLVPSALGYGPVPPRGVRANAVLIFEITVVDVF